MIYTIFIISLFCVGLRMASNKGLILYFLRMPYEFMNTLKGRSAIEDRLTSVCVYVMKPLIGCVTCMGSFYGVIIYTGIKYYLSVNDIQWENTIGNNHNIFEMIVCCVASMTLNTLLYTFYEVMKKDLKA